MKAESPVRETRGDRIVAASAVTKGGKSRNDPARRPILILGLAIAIFLAKTGARAEEWKITPSVSIFESFTSNARLAPPGDEEFDFFTTVSPAIDIHGNSPRLKLDLSYDLDAIGYARETDLSEFRNQLRFSSTATLVPEMGFIDARAAVSQQPKT